MRENSEDNYEFSSADTTAPQSGRDPVNQNFRPIRPGKVVHLKRSTSFIETFPDGPNSDPLSFGLTYYTLEGQQCIWKNSKPGGDSHMKRAGMLARNFELNA